MTLFQWRKLLKEIGVKVSVKSNSLFTSAEYNIPSMFFVDGVIEDEKQQRLLQNPDFVRAQKLNTLIKENFDAVQALAREQNIVGLTNGFKFAEQITSKL